MGVIRYKCSFSFETLFAQLQTASPNPCPSQEHFPLSAKLLKRTVDPPQPPPSLLHCDFHFQPPIQLLSHKEAVTQSPQTQWLFLVLSI